MSSKAKGKCEGQAEPQSSLLKPLRALRKVVAICRPQAAPAPEAKATPPMFPALRQNPTFLPLRQTSSACIPALAHSPLSIMSTALGAGRAWDENTSFKCLKKTQVCVCGGGWGLVRGRELPKTLSLPAPLEPTVNLSLKQKPVWGERALGSEGPGSLED